MTDKELRKLKRAELIEMLYYMHREIDDLTEENQKLREECQQLSSALDTVKLALEKIELIKGTLNSESENATQEGSETIGTAETED